MIEPSIEALLKCTDNNKYKLCILAEKRAKKLPTKSIMRALQQSLLKRKKFLKHLKK